MTRLPKLPCLRRSQRVTVFLAAAVISALAGCNTGFHTGLAAYEGENYAQAAVKLQPLAEQGHARSQFLFGLMHERGHGVEQDLERAAHWYRAAAEQGFAPAQTNLGVALQTGAIGAPEADSEADSEAEPDFARAAQWYQRAADQGHAAARHNLAMLYLTGEGVEADRDRARQLLGKAARDGDANAQFLHGSMLAESVEDEGAWRKAAHWYTKAAEQNHAQAQFALGVLYDTGRGVRPDYEKAVDLYTSAAEAGHAPAQHNLALMYAAGRGVGADLKVAQAWHDRSQSADSDAGPNPTAVTAVPTP